MKILISDYRDVLDRDLEYEIQLLKQHLNPEDIAIYPYESKELFMNEIVDTDVLLTAFLPIDKEIFEKANHLKCISINAIGYGNVEISEATKHGVGVCHVGEYCTTEVADHTMAFILALDRQLKHYGKEIEESYRWNYQSAEGMKRLDTKVLAIFGFGRIGQAVSKRAKAFGIKVIAVDPYISKEVDEEYGVTLVDKDYAIRHADIISNHMNDTEENKNYFSQEEFNKMKSSAVFINVGRGETVDEEALIYALDHRKIKGAALDVLKDEDVNLKEHPLVGRENVILTPHAAFYSDTSMEELQRVSCWNIIHYMKGDTEKVFRLINKEVVNKSNK